MKRHINASVLLAGLLAAPAFSATITNGDFATCDFSGWQKDTDGFGDVSTSEDFTITGAPGICAATLKIDGSNTEAFFANTLYQEIDITGAQMLSFDISVNSMMTSADAGFIADYFAVAFHDGMGNFFNQDGVFGSILEMDIDGAATFSTSIMLGEALMALPSLSLEFQLLPGVDMDGMTDMSESWLSVDNVSLSMASVPAPATLLLLGVGLAGMQLRRRQQNEEEA